MKFEIFKSDKNDQFYFRLKAGNGEIILSSEGYTTKAAAKNGIESVQKNAVIEECYAPKEAANGKFHFNLVAMNKQVIGSSQLYGTEASMKGGMDSVKRVAPQATIEDLTVAG